MLSVFLIVLFLTIESRITPLAPLLSFTDKDKIIPGEYIIKFREEFIGRSSLVEGILKNIKTYRILHEYSFGFSVFLDEDSLEMIRSNLEIEYIEYNSIVLVNKCGYQYNPPSWGLSRISQRRSNNPFIYTFPESSGSNVDVYVIDTGVFVEHKDFEGRASWGFSSFGNEPLEDGEGHGTHVASIIAGKLYGVAKKAKIIAVRVLNSNGAGSIADVVAGVNFVTNAVRKTGKRSIVNMSLSGPFSFTHNYAVSRSIESGIHYVVAAGNQNENACNTSPGSVSTAITVGATSYDDYRAYFSNFGECVNVFAPGVSIRGAYIGNRDSSMVLSGTSASTPYVAGVVALLLSENQMTTDEMLKEILLISTKGLLKEPLPYGTPNNFIFNGHEC
jgi:cerevisin